MKRIIKHFGIDEKLTKVRLKQKDFNEILQQRNGEKLPDSSLLKLSPRPLANLNLSQNPAKAQSKLVI